MARRRLWLVTQPIWRSISLMNASIREAARQRLLPLEGHEGVLFSW